MDYESAKKIAEDFLRKEEPKLFPDIIILDAYTIIKPYGYIFCYNSRTYVETGNIRYALYGNAPIVVRLDGSTHYLPLPGYKIEDKIQEYERQQKL